MLHAAGGVLGEAAQVTLVQYQVLHRQPQRPVPLQPALADSAKHCLLPGIEPLIHSLAAALDVLLPGARARGVLWARQGSLS